jgi:hypothetical protein
MIHLKLNGTSNRGVMLSRGGTEDNEMQGSIREADARIQVLHAAIGQDV